MKQPLLKKIFFPLLLAFAAATQAVGQIALTPSTNVNLSKVYELDAVAEGNTISASFATRLSEIKTDLNIQAITGGNLYMRWFVRPSSDTGYTNVQKDWQIAFSFTDGTYIPSVEYGLAWCSNISWTDNEAKYCSATIIAPEGVESNNYQIVCLITNSQGYTLSNNVLTETDIKVAVVFNIKTLDEVLADYPYPDLTSSIQTIEKTLIYEGDVATVDLSLADYKNEIPGYGEIKYLHLYLTDKDGNAIPSNTFELKVANTDQNLTETSSDVGYHLYYPDQYWDKLFNNDNRARFVITKPDGYSWESLRVVAVFGVLTVTM